MALIDFPDVPDLPGVPALPRSPQFTPQVQAILGQLEGVLFDLVNQPPVWGVFFNGKKIINPTSICAVEHKNVANVPTFPVEGGIFANYNKVSNPYTTTVRMIKSGLEIERIEFLNSIDRAIKSLDNYNIVTPEHVYLNCNLTGYDYRRESSNGAYQVIVDLDFTEVRIVQSVYTQNGLVKSPKEPSGAVTKSTGIVQPKKIETQKPQPTIGQSVVRVISGWWDKMVNRPNKSISTKGLKYDMATIHDKDEILKSRHIEFTNLYPLPDRIK